MTILRHGETDEEIDARLLGPPSPGHAVRADGRAPPTTASTSMAYCSSRRFSRRLSCRPSRPISRTGFAGRLNPLQWPRGSRPCSTTCRSTLGQRGGSPIAGVRQRPDPLSGQRRRRHQLSGGTGLTTSNGVPMIAGQPFAVATNNSSAVSILQPTRPTPFAAWKLSHGNSSRPSHSLYFQAAAFADPPAIPPGAADSRSLMPATGTAGLLFSDEPMWSRCRGHFTRLPNWTSSQGRDRFRQRSKFVL